MYRDWFLCILIYFNVYRDIGSLIFTKSIHKPQYNFPFCLWGWGEVGVLGHFTATCLIIVYADLISRISKC